MSFQPSAYKACLFDFDRTLTNSQKQVSIETQTQLKLLVSKGIKIGLCTGRHFATLKTEAFPYFPSPALHIASGGAQVIDSEGSVLWENLISWETVQKLIDVVKLHNGRLVIQEGDQYYGNDEAILNWVSRTEVQIQPLSSLPSNGIPIVVVDSLTQELISALQEIRELTVKVMTNYRNELYADITSMGVSKAVAVEKWCEMQSIIPSQIIGFGDGNNDVEFLQTVGYAAAMGNAVDDVKKLADEVIEDCDHDGVAHWIERYYGDNS